jgi:hypothetical protein
MNIAVFWHVTPCRLLDRCWRFGGTCCLCLRVEGCRFLRNVCTYVPNCTAWYSTSLSPTHRHSCENLKPQDIVCDVVSVFGVAYMGFLSLKSHKPGHIVTFTCLRVEDRKAEVLNGHATKIRNNLLILLPRDDSDNKIMRYIYIYKKLIIIIIIIIIKQTLSSLYLPVPHPSQSQSTFHSHQSTHL